MSTRLKTYVAYSASMVALAILQIVTSLCLETLSENALNMTYTVVSQVVCMGVVPFGVFMCLNRQKSPREVFGGFEYALPKNPKVWLITLGIALLMLPFTMVFVAVTNILLNIIGFTNNFSVGTIYGGVGDVFLWIFFTAVLPAVFEEFTHRGLLLHGLLDRGSEMSAVLISAMWFSLMHGNPSQLIYAFFGGVVFGYMVLKTHSVLPAMCAHFANNALSVILDYSTQKQTALGRWYDALFSNDNIIAFGLLLIILCVALFGVIKLLNLLPKVTESKAPLRPKKFLGAITMDTYLPNGKPTKTDNMLVVPLLCMQIITAGLLLVWGVMK